MRIAVVIPVYNRANMVLEAVASALANRRKPDVLVVVDDGSTDTTGDAVAATFERSAADDRLAANGGSAAQGFAAVGSAADEADEAGPGRTCDRTEVPQILLRTANRGVGAARKAGLAAAVAAIGGIDAVAFLDSDDLWPPCFLGRAEAALAARPDATVALADRSTSDARHQTTLVDDLSAFAAAPLLWIARHGAGIGSCALVRAEAAAAALSLPDSEAPTGQDIPFFAELARRGAVLRLEGPPVVMRRNHATPSGEHRHLNQRYDDAALRWAGLVGTACAAALRGPHDEASRDELRDAVAGRWISAAKDCARRRRFDDGRECLRRARSLGGPAWRILKIEIGLLARRGWSKLGPGRTA